MNKVYSYIKKKKLIQRSLILFASLFISAVTFNLLQLPTKIVTGGTSGIAIILDFLFGFEPSVVIFIASFLLLLIGLILLGTTKAIGALASTILFPVFVDLTKDISNYIEVTFDDMIIIAIFIGVLQGVTTGLVLREGFNNGGISILSEVVAKYKKTSIAITSFFLNMIIVLVGGYYFGWTMVMYAIIILFISSVVLDRVLIGISRNKSVYIMTNKEEAIKAYITNDLKKSITSFKARGGFEGTKRHVIMVVVPNSDYYVFKEGIKTIDKKAFFIVTDSYQVHGGDYKQDY